VRLIPAAARAFVATVAVVALAACTSSGGSSGPSPIPIASVESGGGSVVKVPPATTAPTPDLTPYYGQ
jgi:hypothetical protein